MKSVCAQNHRTSPKFDRDWNLDDCAWRALGNTHASPLGELDIRELLVQTDTIKTNIKHIFILISYVKINRLSVQQKQMRGDILLLSAVFPLTSRVSWASGIHVIFSTHLCAWEKTSFKKRKYCFTNILKLQKGKLSFIN